MMIITLHDTEYTTMSNKFTARLRIFGTKITLCIEAIHNKNTPSAYDLAEDLISLAKRIEDFRNSEGLVYPPHVYNIALYASFSTAEQVFAHLGFDVPAL